VCQIQRLGAGAVAEPNRQDARIGRDAGKALDFAVAAGCNSGGVCAGDLVASTRCRVVSEIALDVGTEQRLVDLHAFIDDADVDVGATAGPVPGALNSEPIEGGAEAALVGRSNPHD
jgi:hypothetical protein